MRICYVPKAFSPGSRDIIRKANSICSEYRQQGYDLTLRQLYYQFVARGYIANKDTEYKRLGSIINDARLAGELDWTYIEDRTRNLQSLSHWTSPSEIMRAVGRQYLIEKWADQPVRVEVWVEKEALAGVVQRACQGLDVDYFSCRGYVSQSEMHGAGERARSYIDKGKRVVVLHLGDHDPSGIDMTRDIRERLTMFAAGGDNWQYIASDIKEEWGDSTGPFDVEEEELERYWRRYVTDDDGEGLEMPKVERIALNMDQVRRYNPPPNPAKLTDSRCIDYIRNYGNESWELDALDPATLNQLITDEVLALRDEELWAAQDEREKTERGLLREASDRWDAVAEFLGPEAEPEGEEEADD